MSYRSSRMVLLVALVACLVLAIPIAAGATAAVSKVPVEVGVEQSYSLMADGGALAYMSRVSGGQPVTWGFKLTAADAVSGAKLAEDFAGDIPDMGDFDGEWIGYRDSPVSSQIKAMSVSTGESKLIAESYDSPTAPMVDGGRIAWGERDPAYGWIYRVADLTTGDTDIVAQMWVYPFVHFSGDRLYFTYTTAYGDTAISYVDIKANTVTNLMSVPIGSAYDLNDTSVEWTMPTETGTEFYRTDFATGQVTSLGRTTQPVSLIDSDDRLIAWASSNGTDYDVWCYDSLLRSTMLVAGGPGDQVNPSVTGMHVGYRDTTVAENNGDIYSATLSYTQPDIGRVTVPKQLKAAAQGKFAASFSNPDANDTAVVVWDFGDGNTAVFDVGAHGKSRPNYAYSAAGTYEGSVTITDASGMKDNAKFTVVVR